MRKSNEKTLFKNRKQIGLFLTFEESIEIFLYIEQNKISS